MIRLFLRAIVPAWLYYLERRKIPQSMKVGFHVIWACVALILLLSPVVTSGAAPFKKNYAPQITMPRDKIWEDQPG